MEAIAKLDILIMVELLPFGNLYKAPREVAPEMNMGAYRHLIMPVNVEGMVEFYLSLKREEGESEPQQKISVF